MNRYLLEIPVLTASGSQYMVVEATDEYDAIMRYFAGEGVLDYEELQVQQFGVPVVLGLDKKTNDTIIPPNIDEILQSIINMIPKQYQIQSREGGGPENLEGTLCLSVNRMVHELKGKQ